LVDIVGKRGGDSRREGAFWDPHITNDLLGAALSMEFTRG